MSSIQETYALLQQMYTLMQQIETQGIRTERQVTKNIESYRKLESVALRYLLIARRMGLPEEADYLLQKVSMMIVAINQLTLTIDAAKAALIGAGPIGWLALGASALYTGLSFYSLSRS